MPQLDTGLYEGEILGHGLTVTKNKGIPQIWMDINVFGFVNSDGTGITEFPSPVKRTVYMLLSDRGAEYAAKDLEVLGFTGSPSRIDSTDDNPIDLVGKKANFYNKWDGQYENWRVSRPNSGGGSRPTLEKTDLMNINNLFGHHFKQAAPDATPTTPPATDGGGAETPF